MSREHDAFAKGVAGILADWANDGGEEGAADDRAHMQRVMDLYDDVYVLPGAAPASDRAVRRWPPQLEEDRRGRSRTPG